MRAVAQFSGTQRAFQRLSKRLRRRSMSHNLYRIPTRQGLRRGAGREQARTRRQQLSLLDQQQKQRQLGARAQAQAQAQAQAGRLDEDSAGLRTGKRNAAGVVEAQGGTLPARKRQKSGADERSQARSGLETAETTAETLAAAAAVRRRRQKRMNRLRRRRHSRAALQRHRLRTDPRLGSHHQLLALLRRQTAGLQSAARSYQQRVGQYPSAADRQDPSAKEEEEEEEHQEPEGNRSDQTGGWLEPAASMSPFWVLRPPKAIRLETHVWHAKRCRMEDFWGYRLATLSHTKGHRTHIRQSNYGVTVYDASFHECIVLRGPLTGFASLLDRISDRAALPIWHSSFTEQAREGSIMLYDPDRYPAGALAPVRFLWSPRLASAAASTDSADSLRDLWLWVHPSSSLEVRHALHLVLRQQQQQQCASVRSEAVSSDRQDRLVRCVDSAADLCRFELRGQLAHRLLWTVLRPSASSMTSPEPQDSDPSPSRRQQVLCAQLWSRLGKWCQTSALPAGAALQLTVDDPRSHFPPKCIFRLKPTANGRAASARWKPPLRWPGWASGYGHPPAGEPAQVPAAKSWSADADLWQADSRQALIAHRIREHLL
jgi:hypothetical protein